jgi:hypothetical protein
MKKYTTEQKAQALKLLEQDGATSHRRTHHGIPPAPSEIGRKPAPTPSNVLSIEEMRTRTASRRGHANSQAPAPEEPLHRETVRATQRHATDLQALRNKALQATIRRR